MPYIAIEDVSDSRISHYRDLRNWNLLHRSSLFIVEGGLLVERLLASTFEVESILIETDRLDAFRQRLSEDTMVYIVPHGQVERIIGFNFHRGVLACGRRRRSDSLDDSIDPASRVLTLVICVDIHDPTNLGTILRNCSAFGADAVILSPRCADPFSRRVLRVSMGASLRIPIIRSLNLQQDLHRLKREFEVQLAATVLENSAEILAQTQRPSRFALLFGNEGHGLDESVIEICDRRITLPMRGGTDSLNAAVASGIFLYHFTRNG